MNMPEAMMKELIETKVAFIERTGIKAIELKPGYVKLSAPIKGNEKIVDAISLYDKSPLDSMMFGSESQGMNLLVTWIWFACFRIKSR